MGHLLQLLHLASSISAGKLCWPCSFHRAHFGESNSCRPSILDCAWLQVWPLRLKSRHREVVAESNDPLWGTQRDCVAGIRVGFGGPSGGTLYGANLRALC